MLLKHLPFTSLLLNLITSPPPHPWPLQPYNSCFQADPRPRMPSPVPSASLLSPSPSIQQPLLTPSLSSGPACGTAEALREAVLYWVSQTDLSHPQPKGQVNGDRNSLSLQGPHWLEHDQQRLWNNIDSGQSKWKRSPEQGSGSGIP